MAERPPMRDRIEALALALWRRDHGLRTEPATEEDWEVYRVRARARLKREGDAHA